MRVKKYDFSLQPILSLKESIEKQQKNQLTKILEQKEQLIQDKSLLEYNRERYVSALKEMSANGIKAEQVKMYNDYIGHIGVLIREKNNSISNKTKEETVVKNDLLSTMKDKKMFSTLKEKNYKSYLYEVMKSEQKGVDELMSHKHSSYLATGV
jgi:flagellar FliJ protein